MLVFATLFGTELGIELLGLLLKDADDNSLNALQAYQNIFWGQTALVLLSMIFVFFIPRQVCRSSETKKALLNNDAV